MSVRSITCPRCGGSGGEWSFASGYRFQRDEDGLVTSMTWSTADQSRVACPTCRGTGQASLLEPLGRGAQEMRS